MVGLQDFGGPSIEEELACDGRVDARVTPQDNQPGRRPWQAGTGKFADVDSLRNNATWLFLVPLYFLVGHKTMMSLGKPGLPQEQCLVKGMILGDSLANELGDEVGQRVNEKVSDELPCIQFLPGHEC